jgi:hypothetical protein
MIVVFWKGWGFPILLIIGCVQMAVCYRLYGNISIEFFERDNPTVYWRTGIFSGLAVAALGYYLNQFRRPKEERAFSKARHAIFGIPVEYWGGFWMLLSVMQ